MKWYGQWRCLFFQGYISIGLEERLKYLRRPQKRPAKECIAPDATPPAKRQPKPVMPQVYAILDNGVGEDDASHQPNAEELKSLYRQVRGCILLLYNSMLGYTDV